MTDKKEYESLCNLYIGESNRYVGRDEKSSKRMSQREFEQKMILIDNYLLDNISNDKKRGLEKEVDFILDRLEKMYHNGSVLKEIIYERYFNGKRLQKIADEKNLSKNRIFILEKEAIERIREVISIYFKEYEKV